MENLPKWAEKFFSLKCTEGRAICSRPDEDVNGWDYLVELPEALHSGPTESRPPARNAFVQVKSTRGAKLVAPIKLSNMLKACRSHDPWFVILIASNQQQGDVSIYARHIWTDLIRAGLTEIRKSSIEGRALNSRRLTIEFTTNDVVQGGIVEWMQEAIESVGKDYSAKKSKLSESIGYENGWGLGNITIEANSEEEIHRAFLGLGDGLIIKHFSLTHARFGVADREPQLNIANGRLWITPESMRPCKIKVKGPVWEPSITLDGSTFVLGLPGLSEEKRQVRFSAPPLDLTIAEKSATLEISLEAERCHSLAKFAALARIWRWSRLGPLDVAIALDGVCQGVVRAVMVGEELKPEAKLLELVVDALCRIVGERKMVDVSIGVGQINAAIGELKYFGPALAEVNMMIEFDADSDVPSAVISLLYFCSAVVGEWMFECLVMREVIEDRIEGGRRQVVAGRPVLLERYFANRVDGAFESKVENDYKRTIESMDRRDNVLELGDIVAYLRGCCDPDVVAE